MQGTELKALRKAAGLSQAAFADALGMARTTISKMETDTAPIEKRTALSARYLAEHPEAAEPEASAAAVQE